MNLGKSKRRMGEGTALVTSWHPSVGTSISLSVSLSRPSLSHWLRHGLHLYSSV